MEQHIGKIWLVGAGPGDPDLLTVKALRLIEGADLIVHDGLVDAAILALAPARAELISVAKARSRHTMPQEAINALLIEQALAGRQVVRLKGGDPFIFGRGGEELEAARAAAVPCEVVPGITAAIGCAAEAGLPLTHREAASAVTFVAGQCKDLSDQNWAGLAGHGRTFVIYMGVATAEKIAEKLIADGVSPAIPVAVLEKGTRGDGRAMRTLLADLGGLVAREAVQSPALIVVGEVAARSDAVDVLLHSNSSPVRGGEPHEPAQQVRCGGGGWAHHSFSADKPLYHASHGPVRENMPPACFSTAGGSRKRTPRSGEEFRTKGPTP